MTRLYKEKLQAILMLTEEKLKYMVKLWDRTFGELICEENLDRLYDHCKSFYDGIINESMEKEDQYKDEIKAVEKEVEEMQRKLGTAISVSTATVCMMEEKEELYTPLLSKKKNLENILADLNTCLEQRRQQINDMILEEATLCKQLGVEERVLQTEPLPSEEEVQEFQRHLNALKQEKMERLKKFCELRDEIKKFLRILEVQADAEVQGILRKSEVELCFEKFSFLQTVHQKYRKQVQNRKILDLYDKRNKLYQRMFALEFDAADPRRYYNRGGQLLKEERERRFIETTVPKIEHSLNELLARYEQEEGNPFLLNGENIRDVMEKDCPKVDKPQKKSPNAVLSARKKSSSKYVARQELTPKSSRFKKNTSKNATPKLRRSLSYAECLSSNLFLKPANSAAGISSLGKSPTVVGNQSKLSKTSNFSGIKSKDPSLKVSADEYLKTFVKGIANKSRSTLLHPLNRRDSL